MPGSIGGAVVQSSARSVWQVSIAQAGAGPIDRDISRIGRGRVGQRDLTLPRV
jgi:hypothetical protein